MPSGNARRLPGGRKAIIYAVLVHLALIALVVVGFRWQAKPAAAPAKVVQAQAVNDAEMQKEDEARQAEAKKKKEIEERRKSAETNLKEQLAREEKERIEAKARAEQSARAQSELARVENLIRQQVERNWVRPAGWTRGMECVVRARLAPTGEGISATIARPSGKAH